MSRQRPLRPKEHVTWDQAVLALRNALPKKWIYRELASDYGIDCEIEVVERKEVTGALVKGQVKGTSESIKGTSNGLSVSIESVRYWLALPLPTILVRVSELPRRVQWIDVREYVRQRDGVDAVYRTNRKSLRFNFKHAKELPRDSDDLKSLALGHQQTISGVHTADDEQVGADFIGYIILIDMFDGDPDAMIQWLREKGSIEQLVNDLPFVVWVKEQVKEHPDFLARVRSMVEALR